jgi:hypothetical protein
MPGLTQNIENAARLAMAHLDEAPLANGAPQRPGPIMRLLALLSGRSGARA